MLRETARTKNRNFEIVYQRFERLCFADDREYYRKDFERWFQIPRSLFTIIFDALTERGSIKVRFDTAKRWVYIDKREFFVYWELWRTVCHTTKLMSFAICQRERESYFSVIDRFCGSHLWNTWNRIFTCSSWRQFEADSNKQWWTGTYRVC